MSDEPETKKPRVETRLDYIAGTVGLGGETYAIDGLEFTTIRNLALRGLRQDLRVSDDPAKTWANLRAGVVPTKAAKGEKPAKVRKLSAVLEAAAHARAEAVAKGANVKPAPGKRLTDTAEFKAALDDARQAVSAWDKAKVREVGKHLVVLQWMAKLAETPEPSVDAFFDAAPAAEASDEMAQAAD